MNEIRKDKGFNLIVLFVIHACNYAQLFIIYFQNSTAFRKKCGIEVLRTPYLYKNPLCMSTKINRIALLIRALISAILFRNTLFAQTLPDEPIISDKIVN